jgi:XTP/dITP diphosphohydrolase
MKIVFATNNKHKLEEVKIILPSSIEILSLRDINCIEELPETGNTLQQNALQKAHYVFDKYGENCFADDTGLEIEILHGRPGVYSARFAGVHASFDDNIEKVLIEMKEEQNRKAVFRTVIALIVDGTKYFFEGSISGKILFERRGEMGFGYDSVFMPDGFEKSFAEMGAELKNKISHRAIAVKKLAEFLNSPLSPEAGTY